MLKYLRNFAISAALVFTGTAHALPIVEADAFTPGDNKAVLETATGLVWMDFGINDDRPFNDVLNSLATDYAGWRLPTAAEVDHLWTDLMGGLVGWNRWSEDFASGGLYEDNWFGLPISAQDDYFHSIMAIFGSFGIGEAEYSDDSGQFFSYTYTGAFGAFKESGVTGFVNLFLPFSDTLSRSVVYIRDAGDTNAWYGTLLVKDTTASVPEPGSILLMLVAFGALLIRRGHF